MGTHVTGKGAKATSTPSAKALLLQHNGALVCSDLVTRPYVARGSRESGSTAANLPRSILAG